MKNFKQLFFGAALALSAATFGLSSCGTDNCADVVCNNGGTCEDGICKCVAGYTGANCENLISNKFRGTYKFWDKDQNGTTYTGTLSITPTPNDPLGINILNFGAFDPANSLTVTQNTDNTNNFYLTGPVTYGGVLVSNVNGDINADLDTIIVSYTAKDSVNPVSQNTGIWVLQP